MDKSMRIYLKIYFVFTLIIFLSSCSQEFQYPSSSELESLGFRIIPENQDLPDISFTDGNNQTRRLSDYKDHVVLLNFWASWCPPCRAEMPSMGKLARELKGTDFIMIPVNVGESQEIVEAFAETYEIDFPLYFDQDSSSTAMMGVSVLPSSILLNRQGSAVAAVQGSLEWDLPQMIELFKKWSR